MIMINGIIYKYTSPSGKIYIGQTTEEKRRRQKFLNQSGSYAGPKINKARIKYGVNNFEYEVIFRVSSLIRSEVIDILNQKEIQYIEMFDSYYNGYNSTKGGNNTYECTEEIRQKLSQKTKEYYETHESAVARPVLQYSIYGDFIKEWKSAREAALELNIEANNITIVCQGKRNYAYDYIWKYKDQFDEVPMKIQIKSKKGSKLPVIEYTLDGIETRRWANMTLAAQDLGYSLGNFSTYCNGRNNHEYKGFLYYRGEKDDIVDDQQYAQG